MMVTLSVMTVTLSAMTVTGRVGRRFGEATHS